MTSHRSNKSPNRRRRGASAVEFALVAPFIFLIVIGMMEIGRVMMVQHVLTLAAREGARNAILMTATPNSVNTTVNDFMSAANTDLTGFSAVCKPTDPSTAQSGDFVTVTVTLPLTAVSKWGGTWLGSEYTLSSVAVMRKEGYE